MVQHVVVLGVSATPALADQGDGLLSCNTGEICFKKDSSGFNERVRHFWWDDLSHHDEYFSHSGGIVMDNVSAEYNRDTECNVYLKDITSGGVMFDYYLMESRQSGGYYYVGSDKNDRNNGHKRCNST